MPSNAVEIKGERPWAATRKSRLHAEGESRTLKPKMPAGPALHREECHDSTRIDRPVVGRNPVSIGCERFRAAANGAHARSACSGRYACPGDACSCCGATA